MTTVQRRPEVDVRRYRPRRPRLGSAVVHYLRTTDPKDIGVLYLVTAFGYFLASGVMAC